MKTKPNETAAEPSGTKSEIAGQLTQLTEAQRVDFLKTMMKSNLPQALELATRNLHSTASVKALFQDGLATIKDLSTIDLWLHAFAPKLGPRSLVRFLFDQRKRYPAAVASSLYFLPSYVSKTDKASAQLMRELATELTERI